MKRLRCAIYTRKSSEEGLDQAFNSLHAQREACEAYVLSQAGEGWNPIPTAYDDGGFSGGSIERPALKRLLADIQAGLIDVVVVYKVDRLTRSLSDFARIVEQFDAASVSFVSVTQAFNTTTSMGRLTLNVLLSFAQFEREVTGERIRDKIAASKKKGMWMGGNLPLGYDAPTDQVTRALVVNDTEARTVRLIFDKYLELRSAHALVAWLAEEGIHSKAYVSARGHQRGGQAFTRGAIFYLLRNRTYIGEIPHKKVSYPGSHPAIVDQGVFERVQAALDERAVDHRQRPTKTAASPLKGVLFDASGCPMSPSFAVGKGGQSYRYYVSTALQRGEAVTMDRSIVRRISARALEPLLASRITRLWPSFGDLGMAVREGLLRRVEALPDSIVIVVDVGTIPHWSGDPAAALRALQSRLACDEAIWIDPIDDTALRLSLAIRPQLTGGKTEMVSADGGHVSHLARRDRAMIRALRTAHARVARIVDRPDDDPPISTKYERNIVRLAFLAPDIQRAIIDGRQPPTLTLQRLVQEELPIAWDRQRAALGF